MAEEPHVVSSQVRFTSEQKMGVALLLVFAFVSLSLGYLQIRNRLYAPFALSGDVPSALKEEVATAEALRFRDTDFDGLSDFDELYLHGTSPYLADTDSDGVSDSDELQKGTDALCAAGKECVNSEDPAESYSATSASVAGTELSEGDVAEYLTDPASVRQLLLDSGLSKELVDTMSDDELLAMISQALQANEN